MKTADVIHYSPAARAFHWATVVLVLIAFTYGPGGSEKHIYSAEMDFDRRLHETLGLIILTLTAVRLAWRFFDRQPALVLAAPWMEFAAKVVQIGLYALLFAAPFAAISGAWLEGHPLTLIGGVDIDPMLPKYHKLGAVIADVHGWLGDTILWLAGAHAGAALFHHYVLRDGVLRSMLPRLR